MISSIKRYFIPIISVILVIVACVKVNIINTKSLSPLGTTDDNFKVVSAEFGKDFQEFIMDKSPIKIYIGEKNDGLAMVKVYNKEINLTNKNFIMNTINKGFGYINNIFKNIKDKISKSTETNNEEIQNKEKFYNKEKNEFDESIDDFIRNINN